MFRFFESRDTSATDILTSIATHGLSSSRPLSIRGSLTDYTSATALCYNQVALTDLERLEETVNSLVFDGKEGFWAIASERKFEGSSDITYQLSDACLNSVVFVFSCDIKTQGIQGDVGVFHWPNARLCGAPTAGEDEYYFEEVRLPGNKYSVPPSAIRAILAPVHLLECVKRAFPSKMIIPVFCIEKKVVNDPIGVFTTYKSVVNQTVLGPNYVRALQSALAEFPEMQTFGVHLTRLPLVFKTEPTETIAKNKETYQGQVDKTWIRLINPSPEQLADINRMPGVQVVREDRRKSNTYLCLYRSDQKEKLTAIMFPKKESTSELGSKTGASC